MNAEPEPEPPNGRRAFRLPPLLDMGTLKLDDLEFDLEQEVTRLRAEGELRLVVPDMNPRP